MPDASLRIFTPTDPLLALGLLVNYLITKPAYAAMSFGAWTRILVGQVNRSHYRLILDADDRVVGVLGWALANKEEAEGLFSGKPGAAISGVAGNSIVFNMWAADTPAVNRLVLQAAREAMHGKDFLYYRRLYDDGRWRLVRLSVTAFVSRHLARQLAASPVEPLEVASAGAAPGRRGVPPSLTVSKPYIVRVDSGPASSPASEARYFAGRARNPAVALGLAVNHLMAKAIYSKVKFVAWSKVLVGQINRGHYLFICDEHERVVGMLGWSLADQDVAERWVQGRAGENAGGPTGDCVLFNICTADTATIHRVLHNAARQAMAPARMLYFRRLYLTGRLKGVRLKLRDAQ